MSRFRFFVIHPTPNYCRFFFLSVTFKTAVIKIVWNASSKVYVLGFSSVHKDMTNSLKRLCGVASTGLKSYILRKYILYFKICTLTNLYGLFVGVPMATRVTISGLFDIKHWMFIPCGSATHLCDATTRRLLIRQRSWFAFCD